MLTSPQKAHVREAAEAVLAHLDESKHTLERFINHLVAENYADADDCLRQLAGSIMDSWQDSGTVVIRFREALGMPSVQEEAEAVERGDYGQFDRDAFLASKEQEIAEAQTLEPAPLAQAVAPAGQEMSRSNVTYLDPQADPQYDPENH